MSPVTGLPAPTPCRPAPARRVGWCVLAAVGLHAALGVGLLLRAQALASSQTAGANQALRISSASASAMHVRWAPAAAPHVDPTMSPPLLEAALDAAPSPAPTVAQDEAPPASERAEGVSPEVTPDAAHAAPGIDADNAFTGYARRDMLDRAPQALGIVQINYPPGVEPGRAHTGRLTLFIDESGTVRKVLVATPSNPEDALPAPFVEAAREAFLQARFTPGERQGKPVKSRIDVEVRFDDRDTAPIETAQQPAAPAGIDRSV